MFGLNGHNYSLLFEDPVHDHSIFRHFKTVVRRDYEKADIVSKCHLTAP